MKSNDPEGPRFVKYDFYISCYSVYGPVAGMEKRIWDVVRKECPDGINAVLNEYDGDSGFIITVMRPETKQETERRLKKEAKRKEYNEKQKIIQRQKRLEEKIKKAKKEREIYEKLKKKFEKG